MLIWLSSLIEFALKVVALIEANRNKMAREEGELALHSTLVAAGCSFTKVTGFMRR